MAVSIAGGPDIRTVRLRAEIVQCEQTFRVTWLATGAGSDALVREGWRPFFWARYTRLDMAVTHHSTSKRYPFEASVRRGYDAIFCVALTGAVIRSCRALRVGAYWPLAVLLVAEWPLWLNLVLCLLPVEGLAVRSPKSLAFLGGFCALVGLMMFAAWTAFDFFAKRCARIDEILGSTAERRAMGDFALAVMRPGYQLLGPASAVVAGETFLVATAPDLPAKISVDVAAMSYVAVGWVSLIGGSVVYFLFVIPSAVRFALSRPSVSLRWVDPASTPGVQLIAEVIGLASVLLLAGMISLLLLATFFEGFFQHPPLLALLLGFFLLFLTLAVRLAIYANGWVYHAVRRQKRGALNRMAARMRSLSLAGDSPTAALVDWVTVYRSVSSAPNLPFGTTAIYTYSAVLLAATIHFGLEVFLFRRGG